MIRTRRSPLLFILVASLLAAADPVAAAGNPDSDAPVPPEARAVDTSNPDRVVGNGTRASCTSKKVVRAVARGGIIRFRCGKRPVTIRMKATATVEVD